jgi:branched-subunit amino acid aminotransferase/4-amino-4-deoxychorismate lyase
MENRQKTYVMINQKLIIETQALISVRERACRFGDGIFETCKIIDGIIYDY